MRFFLSSIFERVAFPLRTEYMPLSYAALLYVVLGGIVLWSGARSMRGMDAARKWTAIGVRLAVLWVLVLPLAGARWVREGKDAEVIVLHDASASTTNWSGTAGKTVDGSVRDFLREAMKTKPARDRLGLVSFDDDATVDALPSDSAALAAGHAIRKSSDGTNIAAGLRLGLASFDPGVRKRLVLISDGNATEGDTDGALTAVAAQHIPVDVVKLPYEIQRDVVVERLHAPAWVRQGETYSMDVTIRWTGAMQIGGRLSVSRQGAPLDMDAGMAGVQSSRHVMLKPGLNAFHVTVPASAEDGVNQFHASFSADNASDDRLPANNSADAFTFVRGRGRVLYVDNVDNGQGAELLNALKGVGEGISEGDHISPEQFPTRLVDLQAYQAVILANVPRGPGGFSEAQDRVLASYVKDMGGGLVVIGGPEALGAGSWQGSALEKILPVELEPPVQKTLPAGALVLVLDCSGSMGEPMPGGGVDKQQTASQSAVLALRTLLPGDQVGVVAFNATSDWVVPLRENSDPEGVSRKILSIHPGGGTNIYPALEKGYDALAHLPIEQASVRHILLLTDGQSEGGDYAGLLSKCNAAKITVSTVAVGDDADTKLLAWMAEQGRGASYVVNNAGQLSKVFIREARTLRRALIHEPKDPIEPMVHEDSAELLKGLGGQTPPALSGMVLSVARRDPTVEVALSAPGMAHDPILAYWPTGLGRVAVFTSDATRKWAADWVGSPRFASFWVQLVKSVSRPPLSNDFEVSTVLEGKKTRLVVEGTAAASGAALNFYSFNGKVMGPNQTPTPVRLSSVGPGRYEALLDTPDPGAYVAAIEYSGPKNAAGTLLAGVVVPASAEYRDLHSNDGLMEQIAVRTGGRIYPALAEGSPPDLFAREGLPQAVSSQPIQDILILILIPMCLVDVAVRRIAWDWEWAKQWMHLGARKVREFTLTYPKVEGSQTLEMLKKARTETTGPQGARAAPSPQRKFEAERPVEGDISTVVGGAKDQPIRPERPVPIEEQAGDRTSSLFAAKNRARKQIQKNDH